MKQTMAQFAFVLLLLTALGCSSTDKPIGDVNEVQTLTGTIQGNVQSIDGTSIQVRLLKDGQLVAQTETVGSFEINEIQPDIYTLHISADGYKEIERTVTVVAGETFSLGPVLLEALTQSEELTPGEGLRIGSQAPNFALPDGNGQEHSLSDYIADGKKVVLVFYRTGG